MPMFEILQLGMPEALFLRHVKYYKPAWDYIIPALRNQGETYADWLRSRIDPQNERDKQIMLLAPTEITKDMDEILRLIGHGVKREDVQLVRIIPLGPFSECWQTCADYTVDNEGFTWVWGWSLFTNKRGGWIAEAHCVVRNKEGTLICLTKPPFASEKHLCFVPGGGIVRPGVGQITTAKQMGIYGQMRHSWNEVDTSRRAQACRDPDNELTQDEWLVEVTYKKQLARSGVMVWG